MDFWSDNFIANMYGPSFLVLYAFVIATVLIASKWRIWSADRTQEERLNDPPEPANAIDIALLRGDVNEVLRLTVVELVQRGFLCVEEKKFLGMSTGQKLSKAAKSPDPRYLSALQRPVFDFFRYSRAATELFSDSGLKEWFRTQCSASAKRLSEYRLITPDEVRYKGGLTALLGACVILGLGGYKLLIALGKGKTNVLFLILFAIFGTIATVLISQAPRISRRGKAYIEKLQTRYAGLKSRITGLTQAVDDSGLIFAVALFGIAALEGTPYSSLVSMFRQATASSGGCGGSGCGGGGCGGGGCGGGCGGCGG